MTSRLVVLLCHRVGVPPPAARYRRMFTSPALLAFQIRVLRFAGYQISTLRDAIDTRGRRAVVTFDDGARDNLLLGLPTCAAHGVPATVFVVSADVGREAATWPESGDPLPCDLLGWNDLATLMAEGWEIGSHGHQHLHLDRHEPHVQAAVATEGHAAIRANLGISPASFSYPYGVVTEVAESAVKQAGFVCAVTTESGANRDPFDPYRIRRIPSGGYRLRHYVRALRVLLDSRPAVSVS